jgi:soluble lytic murein transglycosylase-like protein
MAVIAVESVFNDLLFPPPPKKNARGLMQLIQETVRRFGAIDVFDAVLCTRLLV